MGISKEEIHHISMVNKIKKNPLILNLEDIILSTGETIIFRKDGLNIQREPDGMMFDPTTHILYNIEYKTRHSQNSYQKAKTQLKTSGEKLQSIFRDWEVKNLYVSGNNFDVREI